jgi:hypothetical protein
LISDPQPIAVPWDGRAHTEKEAIEKAAKQFNIGPRDGSSLDQR